MSKPDDGRIPAAETPWNNNSEGIACIVNYINLDNVQINVINDASESSQIK